MVPYNVLLDDLAANRLPNFSFIVPNQCQSMHDCGVAEGDRWLRRHLPRILGHLSGHDVVFITWDEGTTAARCCRYAHGGHIVTIATGPGTRRGFRRTTASDHYSLLKAIEARWGFGYIRKAACSCTNGLGNMLRP